MQEYKKGNIVQAKITSIEKYGAFARIDQNYSGLIHISEITEDYVRDINDYLRIGDVINVRILDEYSNRNQLKLSAKNANNTYHSDGKVIKETVFGFYLLKLALPGWIKQKMEEINKNN